MPVSSALHSKQEDVAATILAMEKAALARWAKGDPDGFLEICAQDVVYFDPFLDKPLSGIEELRRLYAGIRGSIYIREWELVDPNVRVSGDMAVLTFQFVSDGDSFNHWNTTEVYQCFAGDWRIVHTHWSLTKPQLAATNA